MEDTILQEVASHGPASWLLSSAMFLTGLIALFVAAIQTDNHWILVGIILITLAEAINRRRLPDPDDPRPSWWPWK
ncbi:MAG: hypothetical protein ABEI27_08150 [Halobellus sp.]|uniref:hypothetical protein n=1 Tax=Halobellus sp. TaxID=1979212 RepID=UPI0035D46C72